MGVGLGRGRALYVAPEHLAQQRPMDGRMKRTIKYVSEERGPTLETAAKLQKDWWVALISAGIVTPAQRDIGEEIRAGYRYVTRPVDWNVGDLDKLRTGKAATDETSEPPQAIRYYAWCRAMKERNLPIRNVLDFIVDGSTCISGQFGRACEIYTEANGWRWRW